MPTFCTPADAAEASEGADEPPKHAVRSEGPTFNAVTYQRASTNNQTPEGRPAAGFSIPAQRESATVDTAMSGARIMSSIAEFHSKNVAAEVQRGLTYRVAPPAR